MDNPQFGIHKSMIFDTTMTTPQPTEAPAPTHACDVEPCELMNNSAQRAPVGLFVAECMRKTGAEAENPFVDLTAEVLGQDGDDEETGTDGAPKRKAQGKRICFTLQLAGFHARALLQWLYKLFMNLGCKYFVCGYELAPTTGNPHLQGYFVSGSNIRFARARKYAPQAHLEFANGTNEQNRNYCLGFTEAKGWAVNVPSIEIGTMPDDQHATNGKREKDRWDSIYETARTLGPQAVDDSQVKVNCWNNLERISKFYGVGQGDLTRLKTPPGILYYGVSGAGKSHRAREECDDDSLYLKDLSKWWDGYTGQENVLIEELTPEMVGMLVHHLKKWLDVYKFSAETKGGRVIARPRTIIVTSNYSLAELLEPLTEVDRLALRRRFTKVVCFPFRYGDPKVDTPFEIVYDADTPLEDMKKTAPKPPEFITPGANNDAAAGACGPPPILRRSDTVLLPARVEDTEEGASPKRSRTTTPVPWPGVDEKE